MDAHNGVVTLHTHKAGFLAVVRAAMLVILHAVGKRKALSQRSKIQVASEIDPLATIARPCLTAERHTHAGREERSFEFGEMFADHNDGDSRYVHAATEAKLPITSTVK